MTLDTTATSTGKRIAGTLHVRGFVRPAPSRDESLPIEKAEEGVGAVRDQNAGERDQKATR